MPLTERIKRLARNAPSEQGTGNDLFLSKEIFRRIIDRERDRANRTGEVFSLVAFTLHNSGRNQNTLNLLAKTLSPRVRSIDETGWLDSQHVGVLLPGTSSAGACKFADKICHELLVTQIPPQYEILTYPSDKLANPEDVTMHESPRKSDQNRRSSPLWGGWHYAKSQGNVDYFFCLTKKFLKRSFDMFGAIFGLLILSPLFLAIVIIIKVVSSGPVIFKQKRIGYGGQPFTFFKFRTMRPNADTDNHQDYLAQLITGGPDASGSDAPMSKLDNDPQIILFGNLLRKSCLDELPQLFNVLRGDMSLVGPRPPIPYEAKEYLSWHRGRFDAIPGMTGLWQVSGKNKLSFREMVRLDIRYSKERTLWLDVKILLRTPFAIMVQLKDSLKNKNLTIKERV